MYIRVSQIYFKHMNYAKYFVLLPTDSTDLNIRVRSICEFTSFQKLTYIKYEYRKEYTSSRTKYTIFCGSSPNKGQVESHVSRSLIKRKWREMFASPVECGCWQGPMKMVASSDINVGSFDPRNTAFQFTTKPPILCVIFESGANCSLADVVPSHSSINRPVQQLTGISTKFHAPVSKDDSKFIISIYYVHCTLVTVVFTFFERDFLFSSFF